MRGGFAVLDLETTGLEVSVDVIYDLAVVLVDPHGRPDRLVSTLVCPAVDDMIRIFPRSPTFDELADPLAELLAGRTLVAHNAPFDLQLLAAELIRRGSGLPRLNGVWDTLELLRTANVRRRKLRLACKEFGIEPDVAPGHALHWGVDDGWFPWHTATFDAWMTRRLLAELSEAVPPNSETLDTVERIDTLGGVPLLERRAAGIPPRGQPGGWATWAGPDGEQRTSPFMSSRDEGIEPYGDWSARDSLAPRDQQSRYTRKVGGPDRPVFVHPDGKLDHPRMDAAMLDWILPTVRELYADMAGRPLGWPPSIDLLVEFSQLLMRIRRDSPSRAQELQALVDDEFPDWSWWLSLKMCDGPEVLQPDEPYVRKLVDHARAGRKIGQRGFEMIFDWALYGGDLDVAIEVFEAWLGRPKPSPLGRRLARLLRERRRVDGEILARHVAAAGRGGDWQEAREARATEGQLEQLAGDRPASNERVAAAAEPDFDLWDRQLREGW